MLNLTIIEVIYVRVAGNVWNEHACRCACRHGVIGSLGREAQSFVN